MPNNWIWMSNSRMTVAVHVTDGQNGVIDRGPPIVRKFIGQSPNNLIRWMGKNEEVTVQVLGDIP